MLRTLFSKSLPTVGIDIRPDSVRLVELIYKKETASITHAANIPLEPPPHSQETLTQAIHSAKQSSKTQALFASLCLPDPMVTIADIQVQATHCETLLKERIFEAIKNSLTIPINNSHYDFYVLGVCEQAPDALDVKTFIVQTALAKNFMAPVIAAGFIPRYLDLDCCAMARVNATFSTGSDFLNVVHFSNATLKKMILSDWPNWILSVGLALRWIEA